MDKCKGKFGKELSLFETSYYSACLAKLASAVGDHIDYNNYTDSSMQFMRCFLTDSLGMDSLALKMSWYVPHTVDSLIKAKGGAFGFRGTFRQHTSVR
ncbi:MAG: hypothetical protein HC896_15150, partial [Bacteroidales bacterium]|nr:hypothetical protein [Bacteroidales bacterium]